MQTVYRSQLIPGHRWVPHRHLSLWNVNFHFDCDFDCLLPRLWLGEHKRVNARGSAADLLLQAADGSPVGHDLVQVHRRCDHLHIADSKLRPLQHAWQSMSTRAIHVTTSSLRDLELTASGACASQNI